MTATNRTPTHRDESIEALAESLVQCLVSPSVEDCNGEPANLVDAIDSLSRSARQIRDSITPIAIPGEDAAGGSISSLTEAVMGITAGLFAVAEAIRELAEAASAK